MKNDRGQIDNAPSETNTNNIFIAQADPIPPSRGHLEVVPNRPVLRIAPQPNSPTTPIPNINSVGPRINRALPSSLSRIFIPLSIAFELYQWGERMDENNRLPDTVNQNPMSLPEEPPSAPYVPSTPPVVPVGDPNVINNTVNRLVNDGRNDPRGNPVGQPGDHRNPSVEIDLNREINRIEADRDRTYQEETAARQREVNNQLSAEASRNRRAQEDFERRPPTTPSNPDDTIPSYTINNPDHSGEWMRDPEPVHKPTPQSRPSTLPNVPTPAPTDLNLGGSPPRISGDRSTWQPRASQQEEPAVEPVAPPSSEENPEQPEQSTGGRSRDQGDQRRDQSANEQSSSSEEPATSEQQRQIEKLEAKKRAVEKEIAGLAEADRNIANLPNGLEERMNSVGYRIHRGENTRITYPGIKPPGRLPSGTQLHLKEKDGVWTIEQGPATDKARRSNPNTMKRNFLAGTGIKKWPTNTRHQINHLIPDEVFRTNKLTQQLDKDRANNNQESGVDEKGNLLLMPENAAASNSTNPELQKLKRKVPVTENITHLGSHDQYNQRVHKKLNAEADKLIERYTTLTNVPEAEIEAAVKRVEAEMMQELKEADQKIGEGKYEELPPEVRRYLKPEPGNPGKWKLSELPHSQPTNALSDDPVRRMQSIRAATAKLVAASTYPYTPGEIPTIKTPQGYAQTLAVAVSQTMQQRDEHGQKKQSIQSELFRAEWKNKDIEIINPENGRVLATIYPENFTITMRQLLSKGQIEVLDKIQDLAIVQADAANHKPQKSNQRELGA